MKRKIIPLLICVFVLSAALAGCAGKTDDNASASPSVAPEVSEGADSSTAPSPVAPGLPNDFVIGRVASIDGGTFTLTTVNPDGTKTITADDSTTVSVSGSTKTATLGDIAVGDVISVSLSGEKALKIIDNGPDINPDPSAYVSPSPSETAPSPSAS